MGTGMLRRIVISQPAAGETLEDTLQRAMRLLRKNGVKVSGGAIERNGGETTAAIVLLNDPADKPQAIQILAGVGISAESVP